MDLFDDLPPPKAPSELPSNGSASTGSSESKAITDSSRKRSTTSETAAGIEPTRKRLASGNQHTTLILSKFCLILKFYYSLSVHLEHVPGESQDVFGFHCHAFVCERRGERPEMQDAHIAIEDATPALKQLRRLHNEMHALFFNAYSN